MSDELTNLAWLTSINTTVNNGLIPKLFVSTSQMQVNFLLSAKKDGHARKEKDSAISARRRYKKSMKRYCRPSCSYANLIAMALKNSPTGFLQVNDIYRYIEQEYPFYKTAPDGWKNSIRHNLSMNDNFVKVPRPDKVQSKKGYYWTINPQRKDILDLEIKKSFTNLEKKNSYQAKSAAIKPVILTPLSNIKIDRTSEKMAADDSHAEDKYSVFILNSDSTTTVNQTESNSTFEPYEWVDNECIISDSFSNVISDQQEYLSAPSLNNVSPNSGDISNHICIQLHEKFRDWSGSEDSLTSSPSLETLLTDFKDNSSDAIAPSLSDTLYQSYTKENYPTQCG
jgi:hypothetical protein